MAQTELNHAHQLMLRGLDEKIFTAAALLVARSDATVFHETYGTLGGPGTAKTDPHTLFDLASLTKVLATTPCWMVLAAEKPGVLDTPLEKWFPWGPDDKRCITPRQLLAHSSGLPAWWPYYLLTLPNPDRRRFTAEQILAEPLQSDPGAESLYSDLGFMLLGFIIEDETGQSLDALAARRIFEPLGAADDLRFRPQGEEARIALTRPEDAPGLVNDLNARALGGVAGHAGLFGTAAAVARVAAEVLRSLHGRPTIFDSAVTRMFCTKADPTPDGSRALGFDTCSPEGSSSGRFFSARSVGHTGFTGTSLWMDPEQDVIVVLLTNRVFMGEADTRIKSFRPRVHDAVMEAMGSP
ncbi:MAG: beta-lactamase family protein [Desulfomonile sp.]|nr:beta-lactamase family protein [Desulfomonile sp.]